MSGRQLLLNALLIGIAPGADLQPAAHPAQPFGGIGSASRAADGTFLQALHLIGHHGPLRLVQKFLVDYRIWGSPAA